MKKTLFILLASFTLNSFGQDTTYTSNVFGVYGEIYIHDSTLMDLNLRNCDYINPDTLYYTYCNIAEGALFLLVSEYEKYEEMCYNDSSICRTSYGSVVYDEYITIDTINFVIDEIIKTIHYNHTKPTFEGFMQYLKTKFK